MLAASTRIVSPGGNLKHQPVAACILTFALTACGGGSGDTSNSPGAVYRFITPTAGTKAAYAETLVDNLNNTINRTIVHSVLTVNTDGSFVVNDSDPSNNTFFSGSVNHTLYPTTFSYSASAQELQHVIAIPNASPVTCIWSPNGPGAPSPLAAGQAWTSTITETCGGGSAVSYTQTGTYVGMESVTVPAGTFNAYKFQSTLTGTIPGGTTVTQSTTLWRNAASTDSRMLKEVLTYTYSGTPPAQGTTVSVTHQLLGVQ